jgi:hypothetical protein
MLKKKKIKATPAASGLIGKARETVCAIIIAFISNPPGHYTPSSVKLSKSSSADWRISTTHELLIAGKSTKKMLWRNNNLNDVFTLLSSAFSKSRSRLFQRRCTSYRLHVEGLRLCLKKRWASTLTKNEYENSIFE